MGGKLGFSLLSSPKACQVFDSELLKDIIQELSSRLPNVSRIPAFTASKGVLTAVDGTLVEAVAGMA